MYQPDEKFIQEFQDAVQKVALENNATLNDLLQVTFMCMSNFARQANVANMTAHTGYTFKLDNPEEANEFFKESDDSEPLALTEEEEEIFKEIFEGNGTVH